MPVRFLYYPEFYPTRGQPPKRSLTEDFIAQDFGMLRKFLEDEEFEAFKTFGRKPEALLFYYFWVPKI